MSMLSTGLTPAAQGYSPTGSQAVRPLPAPTKPAGARATAAPSIAEQYDVFNEVFVARQRRTQRRGSSTALQPASQASPEKNPSFAKHFFKGMAAPLSSFLDHPVRMSAMMLGGMALAHWLPMTIAPILVVGGALTVFEGAKSLYKMTTALGRGDKAGAAKATEGLGTAATTGLLIALGNKGGGTAVAEGKASLLASREGKSAEEIAAQASRAAASMKNASFMTAARENLSAVTSKDGLAALGNNFTPTALRKNFHLPSALTSVDGFKAFLNKLRPENLRQLFSGQSSGGGQAQAGIISSFVDDLVILSFAKGEQEESPSA